MNISEIDSAFRGLEGWISANGWAGYDPYDLRGQDWYVRLLGGPSALSRKLRSASVLAQRWIPPLALRKALFVRPAINSKGMGLFAAAYLTKFRTTQDAHWLEKAEQVLAWLAANPSTGHPGISWGYPFHWNSRVFIPRGTPSVVVTGVVADAWLDHYELTGSPRSLEVALGVREFFVAGLNRSVDEADRLCFSYTPLDRFKVHNASLFAAAFLARLSALAGDGEAAELSRRAVRYTLSEQNPDGSFYYWGSEPPSVIDHYHTGFVLRHLDTVRSRIDAAFVDSPLTRGYAFYLQRMFTDDNVPKHTPDTTYPVNVHSCAEALLCIAQLGPALGGLERLGPVFEFTQRHMRSSEGWYFAELKRSGRGVKIPYLRWGQAWMLLALARTEAACASA